MNREYPDAIPPEIGAMVVGYDAAGPIEVEVVGAQPVSNTLIEPSSWITKLRCD